VLSAGSRTHKIERTDDVVLEVPAVDYGVEEALLEEKLGALEALR
jgi:hypothetical protein